MCVPSAGSLRLQKTLVYGFATNIVKDLSMNSAKINCSLKNQIPKRFNQLDTGSVKIALKILLNVSVVKRRERYWFFLRKVSLKQQALETSKMKFPLQVPKMAMLLKMMKTLRKSMTKTN